MTILIAIGVGFIWGGVVVWIVERRRFEDFFQGAMTRASELLNTQARLRGDTHALATWLILARNRIKEAESLLAGEGGDAVSAWEKRVRETVWEIRQTDIEVRSHVAPLVSALRGSDGGR